MGEKVCQSCGDELVTPNFDHCRNCVIEENEDLVEAIEENFSQDTLRELNVVYTEAKNRIARDDE